MEKKARSKARSRKSTALVILGWLTFVCTFYVNELWYLIPLQAVARVLP